MTAARVCAVLGLAVMVLSGLGVAQVPTCGVDGGLGPVLALEFARGPGDVVRLLGDAACGAALVPALRDANVADEWAFIPAFVGFLVMGAVMLRRVHPAMAWAAALLVLGGGVCDELEDRALLEILAAPPGRLESFAALSRYVPAK